MSLVSDGILGAFLLRPFLASVIILYLVETPVNEMFSGVFKEYKTGILTRNGLISDLFHQQESLDWKFFTLHCNAPKMFRKSLHKWKPANWFARLVSCLVSIYEMARKIFLGSARWYKRIWQKGNKSVVVITC